MATVCDGSSSRVRRTAVPVNQTAVVRLIQVKHKKKGFSVAIVRIDFSTTQTPEFGKAVAAVVDRVMTEVLSVPARENFIVCQAHEAGMLLHDPENTSQERLGKIVFIQVTLNQGRTDELKDKFFSELTSRIAAETGALPQNVFINLVEVAKTNWSFGRPNV